MTASDLPRKGIQAAVDLAVFAPVGLVLTVVEDLPGVVAKGRRTLTARLHTARAVGQVAVTMGQARFMGSRSVPEPHPATPSSTGPSGGAGPWSDSGVAGDPGPAPDAAIPGYDTLSASHVVRRLEGLGRTDLQAVYRYERAHRGRSTVLARTEQLLRGDGPPA